MSTVIKEHRLAITNALGLNIPMHIYKQNTTMNMYVGLWGYWWLNGEIGGAKILLATSPATSAKGSDHAFLNNIPWTILQFHSITPNDAAWTSVHALLKDEIESMVLEKNNEPRCTGRITYNTEQKDMSQRTFANEDFLQRYTITRDDNDDDGNPRPSNISNRKRIPYNVQQGSEDDLQALPMKVYIEKNVPKRTFLGQRLHSETGLSRTSSLLSAIHEWGTWIILGD